MDGRLRPAAVAVALGAALLLAGCYLPYPVPAGSLEERRPAPARPDPEWDGSGCPRTVGQEALERVNAIRREHGLVPLQPHPELVAAARAHTEAQAARDRVTHRGPDGSAVSDRVELAGYAWSSVGENVGGGFAEPAAMVRGWMESAGHRAIILSPEPHHGGLGYVYRPDGRLHHFWTLVVADPGGVESTPATECHS